VHCTEDVFDVRATTYVSLRHLSSRVSQQEPAGMYAPLDIPN